MKVYIVSWGLARNEERVEIDAIVHSAAVEAREEFDLVDVASVGKGAYDAALAQGWGTYCSLSEVEMLDDHEQPTRKIADWVYDGERTLLDEKLG